jgi:hypothetical protein
MKPALMSILVVAAVSCGGPAKPDSTAMGPAGDKHEMGQMGDKGEMASMPPSIASFHDTLAPRWHAKHGPQRMTDTCGAIAQFHTGADAIVAAPPPSGGDAAAWSAGGTQLAEAVATLDTTCKANDAAAFEPAFERVHKTFHGLMEAASGHHDEHGEHAHGDPPH